MKKSDDNNITRRDFLTSIGKATLAFSALSVFDLARHAAHAATGIPEQKINEIRYPLFAYPAIAKSASSFSIAIAPGTKKVASVAISPIGGPAKSITLDTAPSASANGLDGLTAAIPASAPEALYDLIVTFTDKSTDTQPHAVKVIREFKDNYKFIHLTDIHFNVEVAPGYDYNPVRIKIIEDINQLNPEFIIFGGDLNLWPENYDEDYITGYNILTKHLKVPIFIVPGNHELYTKVIDGVKVDGKKYYDAMYGTHQISFDYGKLHFTGINNFDWPEHLRAKDDKAVTESGIFINSRVSDEMFAWFKNDVATARAAGQTVIPFMHIPMEHIIGGKKVGFTKVFKIDGATSKEFIAFLNEQGVKTVLIGHVHINDDRPFANTIETLTITSGYGTGGSHNSLEWGYRVFDVTGSENYTSQVVQFPIAPFVAKK